MVYNAPIVAVGNGPFDVIHHTNTGDRVIGINTTPTAPGAGHRQHSAGPRLRFGPAHRLPPTPTHSSPLAATYERTTYVPALNNTDLDTLATALYVKTDDLLKESPHLAPWRPGWDRPGSAMPSW